jgi:hypothetical protein
MLSLMLAAFGAVAVSASVTPPRAFTVLGPDSSSRTLPERGSGTATDVSRRVADISTLFDGRIVVLNDTGRLDAIDGSCVGPWVGIVLSRSSGVCGQGMRSRQGQRSTTGSRCCSSEMR